MAHATSDTRAITPPDPANSADVSSTDPAEGRTKSIARAFVQETQPYRLVLGLVIGLVIYFAITQDNFLTVASIEIILTSTAILWVAAIAATFTLLAGGADLSQGAFASLGGIFLFKALEWGVPTPAAILLTIAFGFVVAIATNGFLMGYLGLAFFVVTLGTLTAFSGVVLLWSGSRAEFVADPFLDDIGTGRILGIPILIWIMAGVFLLALYVERWTYFGRDTYATGGSPTAAKLSGINTARTLCLVYGISGAAAAFAGVLSVARTGSASPTVNVELALLAIAAALLGGTKLTGGAGSVVGTALGVLFIAVLQNGLSGAGVSNFWQQIVTGVILVAAVLGDRERTSAGRLGALLRRRRRRTAQA